MQKIKTILVLGALLGSAAAFATQCTKETIEGTYTETQTGWYTNPVPPVTRVPYVAVGVYKFKASDGIVTVPSSLEVVDGGIAFEDDSPGTYTVSPVSGTNGTCKVLMVLWSKMLPVGYYHLTGVTSDNGNHISFTQTDVEGPEAGWTYLVEAARVSH